MLFSFSRRYLPVLHPSIIGHSHPSESSLSSLLYLGYQDFFRHDHEIPSRLCLCTIRCRMVESAYCFSPGRNNRLTQPCGSGWCKDRGEKEFHGHVERNLGTQGTIMKKEKILMDGNDQWLMDATLEDTFGWKKKAFCLWTRTASCSDLLRLGLNFKFVSFKTMQLNSQESNSQTRLRIDTMKGWEMAVYTYLNLNLNGHDRECR